MFDLKLYDPKGRALAVKQLELYERMDDCCDYDLDHIGDLLDDLDAAVRGAMADLAAIKAEGKYPSGLFRERLGILQSYRRQVHGFYRGRLWSQWNAEHQELEAAPRKWSREQVWRLWDGLLDVSNAYRALGKDCTMRERADALAHWERSLDFYDIARCQCFSFYRHPFATKRPLYRPEGRRPTRKNNNSKRRCYTPSTYVE